MFFPYSKRVSREATNQSPKDHLNWRELKLANYDCHVECTKGLGLLTELEWLIFQKGANREKLQRKCEEARQRASYPVFQKILNHRVANCNWRDACYRLLGSYDICVMCYKKYILMPLS